MKQTILVTGSTGTVGQKLIKANLKRALLFSNVLGHKVTYEPLTPSDYILAKQKINIPPEFTKRFIQFFKKVEKKEYERVSSIPKAFEN